MSGIDIRPGKQAFIRIRALSRVIVMEGQHGHGIRRRAADKSEENERIWDSPVAGSKFLSHVGIVMRAGLSYGTGSARFFARCGFGSRGVFHDIFLRLLCQSDRSDRDFHCKYHGEVACISSKQRYTVYS